MKFSHVKNDTGSAVTNILALIAAIGAIASAWIANSARNDSYNVARLGYQIQECGHLVEVLESTKSELKDLNDLRIVQNKNILIVQDVMGASSERSAVNASLNSSSTAIERARIVLPDQITSKLASALSDDITALRANGEVQFASPPKVLDFKRLEDHIEEIVGLCKNLTKYASKDSP